MRTPDEYLLAFHARHPGLTARAFARGRLADGRSSYDLLADLARPGEAVLDLGCGDGYLLERIAARCPGHGPLVGLDMSAEELAAAAARPGLTGAQLVRGRAQELGLGAGSMDLVVSHLAFMLMSEIERVVVELARVLRPGGRFATVVGGGPGAADAFELFLGLFRDAAAAAPARAPRIGDRRTRDAIGLGELLRPATGFSAAIEESVHELRLDGTAEEVWDSIGTVYEMFVLDEPAVAALRARFLEQAAALADGAGVVPCTMRLRLLTATRR